MRRLPDWVRKSGHRTAAWSISLYILDTDHVTIARTESDASYGRLVTRLSQVPRSEVATTIISYQEQMQGWLAYLNRAHRGGDIVFAYEELQAVQVSYMRFTVLPFTQEAQMRYANLRPQCRRLGAMDLRIAAVAVSTDSTILTRNLRDFQQVPGLKVEDWTN